MLQAMTLRWFGDLGARLKPLCSPARGACGFGLWPSDRVSPPLARLGFGSRPFWTPPGAVFGYRRIAGSVFGRRRIAGAANVHLEAKKGPGWIESEPAMHQRKKSEPALCRRTLREPAMHRFGCRASIFSSALPCRPCNLGTGSMLRVVALRRSRDPVRAVAVTCPGRLQVRVLPSPMSSRALLAVARASWVRFSAVGASRVRPASIERRKRALDGRSPNPGCANGRNPHPESCRGTEPEPGAQRTAGTQNPQRLQHRASLCF